MARRRKKSRLGGLVRGVLALAVIAGAGAVLLRVAGVELGFLPEGLFRTEEALPVQGEDSGAESAAGQPPADAPPVIRLAADTVWIHTGESYDPTANLSEVSDPEDGALSYLPDAVTPAAGSYTTISTVDPDTPGAYVTTVSAMDSAGNLTETGFSVRVLAEGEEPGSAGATYIDGILLVNRDYPLPRDEGAPNAEANAALAELQAAAAAEGYDLPTISGYRDFDTQVRLFNQYVRKDGLELAIRYSAPPGQSEHQTGLCFDVASLWRTFADTEEGIWLAEHCAEYGFIIRFPAGKEAITGYMYEPWHIRYVGREVAEEIMAEPGLTLEEYLGVA